MKLAILEGNYAVCRLSSNSSIPPWSNSGNFWSVSKTANELSIVCSEESVPSEIKAEKNWGIIEVEGPINFQTTGVLFSLAEPLKNAKISIFAISTFDTDYIMVKKDKIVLAKEVLVQAGFEF